LDLAVLDARLSAYVMTSFICMAPGAIAYTWLGHAGREAHTGDITAIRYGLMALGLLATIGFVPRMVRRMRNGATSQWIATDELASRLESDAITIIEVRSPEEFAGPLGQIETALNIPLGELPDRLIEIRAFQDRPVILVCKTDKCSAVTAAMLDDSGFCDVSVLRGRMDQWKRDSRPVDRCTTEELSSRYWQAEGAGR
jgi:rhodanese-related sulfurtransferase